MKLFDVKAVEDQIMNMVRNAATNKTNEIVENLKQQIEYQMLVIQTEMMSGKSELYDADFATYNKEGKDFYTISTVDKQSSANEILKSIVVELPSGSSENVIRAIELAFQNAKQMIY